MHTTIKRYFGIAILLLASQASAQEYNRVQTNESAVTFGYRQMGVAMDGKFGKFAAKIAFDPARLDKANARIDIDIASIDTGVDEADAEAVGKPWFNARTYPTASFVSSGIKALGGERYQATGKLSIKGRTQEVTTPVTFTSSGARGVFEGSFGIKRLDYAIGEGEWADVGAVANEIQIKFHIVVSASK